jgi:nucleoside-diphosphate kinase
MLERSLVLVKPDATKRNLSGEIISRFEKAGLKIVGMKLLHMDKNLAKRHYAVHEGKPFLPRSSRSCLKAITLWKESVR